MIAFPQGEGWAWNAYEVKGASGPRAQTLRFPPAGNVGHRREILRFDPASVPRRTKPQDIAGIQLSLLPGIQLGVSGGIRCRRLPLRRPVGQAGKGHGDSGIDGIAFAARDMTPEAGMSAAAQRRHIPPSPHRRGKRT